MKLDWSFPMRTIVLIGLIVVIPLVVFGTTYVAQGKIAFSSTIPGAYVVDVETEIRYDVPATVTKRVGNHRFTLEAPGHAIEEKDIRFPTFRLTKKLDFTLDKKLYDEEDPDALKKVPLGTMLPYESPDFEIDIPDENGYYSILLSPDLIVIPEVSAADLTASLKEDKPKALQWLSSQGVKATDIKIKWLPYDPDTGP